MRTATIAGLTVLTMLTIGPWPLGAQSAVTVDVQDFSFQPHEWTIQAGTVVSWVNHDEWPHHVAAEDGKSFNSGIIGPGKDFKFTFTAPGRYSYRCGVHPTMSGVIIVQSQ
jgi:plastocyanin